MIRTNIKSDRQASATTGSRSDEEQNCKSTLPDILPDSYDLRTLHFRWDHGWPWAGIFIIEFGGKLQCWGHFRGNIADWMAVCSAAILNFSGNGWVISQQYSGGNDLISF